LYTSRESSRSACGKGRYNRHSALKTMTKVDDDLFVEDDEFNDDELSKEPPETSDEEVEEDE